MSKTNGCLAFPTRVAYILPQFPSRMANIYLPFPPRLAYVLPSISAESGIYITFHFRTEWHIYYLPFPYRLALFYLTFPPRVAYTSLTYPFRVVYILPYISVQDGLYFTFHFRPDWHIFYLPFPSRVIHIMRHMPTTRHRIFTPQKPSSTNV